MSEVYAEQSAADEAIGAGGQTDYINVTAATTLPKYARRVRTSCSGATYIVKLPLLSSCVGAIISIVNVVAGVGEIQVLSRGDGIAEAGVETDIAGDSLNNVGDHLVFLNTGLKWVLLSDNTN